MLERISAHLMQVFWLSFFGYSAFYSFELVSQAPAQVDFYGQWAICAYTLHGVDPYEIIGVEPPLLVDIGSIPSGWRTSPWGCVLGNLFYPGFLPLQSAKIYFVVINVMMIALTVATFVKRMMLDVPRGFLIRCALVLSLAPGFWISIYIGNCGGCLCCLLLMACLIAKDHPTLSGMALSIAMIKPQAALIICFAFLLMKQFRPLIVAASVDLLAWGATSLLVERSPIALLNEMLSSNIDGSTFKLGILYLLADKFPSESWTMPLSMLFGMIFVAVLQRFFVRTQHPMAQLAVFIPAFTALNFWSYSRTTERFSLIILVLFGLWLLEQATTLIEQLLYMSAMVFCNFCAPIFVWMYHLLERLTGVPQSAIQPLIFYQSVTLIDIVCMAIAIFFTIKLTRSDQKALS